MLNYFSSSLHYFFLSEENVLSFIQVTVFCQHKQGVSFLKKMAKLSIYVGLSPSATETLPSIGMRFAIFITLLIRNGDRK
jgi:hypothetical protein